MFKLFKDKLDLAKDAYEACHRHRRSHLVEFRKNASREVILTYPDAKVLSNIGCDSFLAYSKSSNLLISGRFADKLFPHIQYIDDCELRPKAFEEAVSMYKAKLTNFSENTTFQNQKRVENPELYFRMNPEIRSDFIKKGYSIYGESNSELVIGGKVIIDDLTIASANCVDPKENGYFTKKIYNEIAFNSIPNEAGISTLTLELTTFGYCEFSTYTHYITYDSRVRFVGDSGFKSFNTIFSGLLDFISAIEHEISSMPRELVEETDADWEVFLRREFGH